MCFHLSTSAKGFCSIAIGWCLSALVETRWVADSGGCGCALAFSLNLTFSPERRDLRVGRSGLVDTSLVTG